MCTWVEFTEFFHDVTGIKFAEIPQGNTLQVKAHNLIAKHGDIYVYYVGPYRWSNPKAVVNKQNFRVVQHKCPVELM